MLRVWLLLIFLVVGVGGHADDKDCRDLLSGTSSKKRIAVTSYPVEGGLTVEAYLDKLDRFIRAQADLGADLVVTAELSAADLLDFTNSKGDAFTKQWQAIAQDLFDRALAVAVKAAQEKKIYVVLGGAPRATNGRIFNTAALISSDGKAILQDKLYLTGEEKDWGWSGGEVLNLVDSPFGRIVILTCYDAEIAKVSSLLSQHKPELIIVPSMTGRKGYDRVRWTAQARAIEHKAFVVLSGTSGNPGNLWKLYSNSAVIGPSDKYFNGVIAEGEQQVIGEIDIELLRKARQIPGPYPAQDEVKEMKAIKIQESKL